MEHTRNGKGSSTARKATGKSADRIAGEKLLAGAAIAMLKAHPNRELILAGMADALGENVKQLEPFAAKIKSDSNEELLKWICDMIANDDQPESVRPENRDAGWRVMFGIVKAECLRRMSATPA